MEVSHTNKSALDIGQSVSERRTRVHTSCLRHCLTWQSSDCFGMLRMNVQQRGTASLLPISQPRQAFEKVLGQRLLRGC